MTRDDATPPSADSPDASTSPEPVAAGTVAEPAEPADAAAPADAAPASVEPVAEGETKPEAEPAADADADAEAKPDADAEPVPVAPPAPPKVIHAGGVVAPSLEDPVARAACEIAGGPAGRHLASATKLLRAASVLVLLAACMMGFGLVQKQHCRNMGWNSPDFFWHACYSDIPIAFVNNGLREDPEPTLAQVLDPSASNSKKLGQPPLAGATMWAVAKITPLDDNVGTSERRYFDLSALVLTIALAIGVAALAMSGTTMVSGRRPWDAAHLALSPVLITSALINYQLLAVALLAVAMALWSREKPLLAGILLGLAATATSVSMVVAVAAVALAVSSRRWWPALQFGAASVIVVIGLRAVLLPGNTGQIREAWTAWKAADVQFGSLWLLPSLLHDSKPNAGGVWKHFHAMTTTHASQLSIAVALFGVAAMIGLALSTKHRPTLGQLALIGVGFFLLSSKNLAPQSTLILLPLIAAAGLKWRDHLIWAGAEVTYYVMVWMYIGAQSDAAKGLPPSFYMIFMMLRLMTVAWLMVAAVNRSRNDMPTTRADDPDDVPAPEPVGPAPVVEPVPA